MHKYTHFAVISEDMAPVLNILQKTEEVVEIVPESLELTPTDYRVAYERAFRLDMLGKDRTEEQEREFRADIRFMWSRRNPAYDWAIKQSR